MRLASSDAHVEPSILSELNCSEQELLQMRNHQLELETRRTTNERPARQRDRSHWSRLGGLLQRLQSGPGSLVVCLSPHLSRCSFVLRSPERPPDTPWMIFLQVTPLAEWLAAGAIIRASDFSHRQRNALSTALREDRHLILQEWFGASGNTLWCRPDTLDWTGRENADLFGADVTYRYTNDLRTLERPLFPVLRADNAETNAAIAANTGLAWRRTVYTNDSEIAKLLTTCEHPDVRRLGFDADFTIDDTNEMVQPSETHTFFLDSFRVNAFVIEIAGPPEPTVLWNFVENCFGRIFGREACFMTSSRSLDAIHVRLASPATPVNLRWRIHESADGPVIFDGVESFAGAPAYLTSRRAFISWAFRLF